MVADQQTSQASCYGGSLAPEGVWWFHLLTMADNLTGAVSSEIGPSRSGRSRGQSASTSGSVSETYKACRKGRATRRTKVVFSGRRWLRGWQQTRSSSRFTAIVKGKTDSRRDFASQSMRTVRTDSEDRRRSGAAPLAAPQAGSKNILHGPIRGVTSASLSAGNFHWG